MPSFNIIEPMSTGDIIDRAVRLYRRNFAPVIAVIAIPTLIQYVTSLVFWFGYWKLISGVDLSTEPPAAQPELQVDALVLVALGGLGYPVWLFFLMMAIAALSRVVGDHVMLGEAITFKRCVAAVRRRLGDVMLMVVLAIALGAALYFVFAIIVFVLATAAVLVAAVISAAGLPPWALGVGTGIVIVVAVVAAIITVLLILSRVAFLPQVVMIEGQSAGSALSRAVKLGKGNWHRFGAMILFTYFVSFSLVAALRLPVMVFLYLVGYGFEEVILGPVWNAIYTGLDQLSNLLALPIFIVALTLLYFDTRVRKEAYDLELLANEIAPGFYWQAYPSPQPEGFHRQYVQTSPLGLAGPAPVASSPVEGLALPAGSGGAGFGTPDAAVPPAIASSSVEPGPLLRDSGLEPGSVVDAFSSRAPAELLECPECGEKMLPEARFCIRCGNETSDFDGSPSPGS